MFHLILTIIEGYYLFSQRKLLQELVIYEINLILKNYIIIIIFLFRQSAF